METKQQRYAESRNAATLTEVQEAAIQYNLNSSRPSAYKVQRKTGRIVREWCEARGYTSIEAQQCVKDMFDVLALQRNAE